MTAEVKVALHRLSFPAFGTKCEVQYAAELRNAGFEEAVRRWVLGFQAKYSRFEPTSLVSRVNAAAGKEWVAVDADMELLLDLCDGVFKMSRGLLDPTALPLMRVWDWKRRAASADGLPSESETAAAMRLVGWNKVRREKGKVFLPEPGMALDFGGFGKEYAVDIVARIAADHGIEAALVDFGHDLFAVGKPPGRPAWHIGLEDPERPGTHKGSMAIIGKGVASSGDYLRSFVRDGRRYGHIVDPRTGRPVDNGCIQATVIAPTCLQAGVLSTTAFMLGSQKGIEFIQAFPGAEGMLVDVPFDHAQGARRSVRAQTRGFFNYVAN